VNAADPGPAPVVHDPGLPGGDTVLAAVDEEGIAWVYFNRPVGRHGSQGVLPEFLYAKHDQAILFDEAAARRESGAFSTTSPTALALAAMSAEG
jgi:hypothetical protein